LIPSPEFDIIPSLCRLVETSICKAATKQPAGANSSPRLHSTVDTIGEIRASGFSAR
jgi:hypothetical protein